MELKSSTKKIMISWIQSSYQGSDEKTSAHYRALAENIEATDLIVFPELFANDYFPLVENETFFSKARTLHDEWFAQYSELAKKKSAVVVVPFFEKSDTTYYNSVVVYERDGSVAGMYRKMHIPYDPGFYEKFYFAEGDLGFTPIKTSVGSIGVLICWDQWFPEAARLMALKGADLLIYPTAIGWDNTEPDSVNEEQLDAWKTTMRAHSICNGVFTIAVNRIGKEGKIEFWGNSFLCKPSGQLVNNPNNIEEVYTTDIAYAESKNYRDIWPFFRDRRINSYQGLLERGADSMQSGMACERKW